MIEMIEMKKSNKKWKKWRNKENQQEMKEIEEMENTFQLIKFLMKLKLVITIKLFLKVKRNMEDIFLYKIYPMES